MAPITARLSGETFWNAPKYGLPNPFVSRDEPAIVIQWRYNHFKETACAD